MIDFSSALYLGLAHGSAELRSWTRLTAGVPAALRPPPGEAAVAASAAALQGCECALLAPSTLHLFWDLFGLLTEQAVTIYLDAGAYIVARGSADRARARGVPVHTFRHHDPAALRRLLRVCHRTRPVVIADGFCPPCGTVAPLSDYLEAVRTRGGLLVVDDTQALGVLGETRSQGLPYGTGGGGSLRHAGIAGDDILSASSLAKAFGAPLAVLAGSARLVRRFAQHGQSRAHCSPPSAAAIGAAAHALHVNRSRGDEIRRRLARRVLRFRAGLRRYGLTTSGGAFPVQTLSEFRGDAALELQHRLQQERIRAVLHRPHDHHTRLSFIISAAHTVTDIDRAVEVLVGAS